ncbi:hypothetical protein BST81_00755 [Leptolyngbya sp. 'hensonii']|uniref:hypothetical protein n=1 Tax=Leptolyngbya sp. 'hensonii' TaxID=1922337 RepID=UPI00094F8FDD|nr:hypothetical protein [Leptolyngbya sp. 'hensonii']OLP20301.1 hypothetical protein BST81_00755 [Leptolyngbya sp. 'hensonii']
MSQNKFGFHPTSLSISAALLILFSTGLQVQARENEVHFSPARVKLTAQEVVPLPGKTATSAALLQSDRLDRIEPTFFQSTFQESPIFSAERLAQFDRTAPVGQVSLSPVYSYVGLGVNLGLIGREEVVSTQINIRTEEQVTPGRFGPIIQRRQTQEISTIREAAVPRLGQGSFAILSKIGLLEYLSVRPTVLIADTVTVLVPVTLDFPIGDGPVHRVTPYVGLGLGIFTQDRTAVDLILTGGLDVPLSPELTATTAVNASVTGVTSLGLLLGIGYSF